MIILGVLIIGYFVVSIIANLFISQMMNDALTRGCCLDADGSWNNEQRVCIDRDLEKFEACLNSDNN